MKNKLSQLIVDILPSRVIYFAIIRAFAYTTVHECSNKTPDEVGFSDLTNSWERKVGTKI